MCTAIAIRMWAERHVIISGPKLLGSECDSSTPLFSFCLLKETLGDGRTARWKDPGSLNHWGEKNHLPTLNLCEWEMNLGLDLYTFGGLIVAAARCTIINIACTNTSYFLLYYIHLHKFKKIKKRITHYTMMLFGFHSWEQSSKRCGQEVQKPELGPGPWSPKACVFFSAFMPAITWL